MAGPWERVKNDPKPYRCKHCGVMVKSKIRWRFTGASVDIRVCEKCEKASFFLNNESK